MRKAYFNFKSLQGQHFFTEKGELDKSKESAKLKICIAKKKYRFLKKNIENTPILP